MGSGALGYVSTSTNTLDFCLVTTSEGNSRLKGEAVGVFICMQGGMCEVIKCVCSDRERTDALGSGRAGWLGEDCFDVCEEGQPVAIGPVHVCSD